MVAPSRSLYTAFLISTAHSVYVALHQYFATRQYGDVPLARRARAEVTLRQAQLEHDSTLHRAAEALRVGGGEAEKRCVVQADVDAANTL